MWNPLALLPTTVSESLGKEAELWFLCPSCKNKNENTKLTGSSEGSLS